MMSAESDMLITNMDIFNGSQLFKIRCPKEKNDECMPIELNILNNEITLKYIKNHLLSFWYLETMYSETYELVEWLSKYNKIFKKEKICIDAFLITDIILETCTRRICFVYLTHTQSKHQTSITIKKFFCKLKMFFLELHSSFKGTCYSENPEITPVVILFDLKGVDNANIDMLFKKIDAFLKNVVDCTDFNFHKISICGQHKKELKLMGFSHVTTGFFIKYMPPSTYDALIKLDPLLKGRVTKINYYHYQDKYTRPIYMGFCKPRCAELSSDMRLKQNEWYSWEQAFLLCRTITLYNETASFIANDPLAKKPNSQDCLVIHLMLDKFASVKEIKGTIVATKIQVILSILYNLIFILSEKKDIVDAFKNTTIKNEIFETVKDVICEFVQETNSTEFLKIVERKMNVIARRHHIYWLN